VTDPVHSEGWTGDIYERSLPHRQFTYRQGQVGLTSDYERLLVARRRAEAKPPEVYPLIFLSLGLFLTPALLFVAGIILHLSIRDAFINDNAIWLFAWGFSAIAIGIAGMRSRSTTLLFVRKVIVAACLLATILFCPFYIYLGISSHAHAVASAPERTYEFAHRCGRRCTESLHQRADGSTVEGRWVGAPFAYGYTCTLVQRLNGDHNFRWVHVIERSAPSRTNMAWPIRREDCFGTKPVSSLHG